jgi:predicted transporter
MVCPVCVAGGIVFILSRILGLPDVIVVFVTGMLATSTAYWGNHIMAKRWKKRKGQLLVLNILSGIMFLYSLKLIGLW